MTDKKSKDKNRLHFLNLQHHPARVNAEQAAWLLGFNAHEIPLLMRAKLLVPLGHPAENGIKYFLGADIERLRTNREWMAKACDAIQQYWKFRNSQRGKKN